MSGERFTIHGIKSPFIRLPVAWVFCSVALVILAPLFLLAVIVDICVAAAGAATTLARETWQDGLLQSMFVACTRIRK